MNKNILIAEDDNDLRDLLSQALGSKYAVSDVGNGKNALSLLRIRHFDLLITDLEMPYMGGYELSIEVSKEHPSLPMMLITANPDGEMYREKGFIEVFIKPFELTDLLEKVERVLSRS
ncbi:MAG: response regulator [Bacteriovoracaceae bacterium]